MSESYKVSAAESAALELGAADTVKSVLQAIKIILTTPKGTVPMYRDFGVNMDFLDLPAPGAEQRARMEIREAIEEWEPRATVKDITFSRDELQSGKLIPTVEVEINIE
jgi:hypothetical protein